MVSNPHGLHKHTLVALLEDEPGALNRVVSLFRARGFNIESMTVGPTETPRLSRLTLVVQASDSMLEQITKQLYKVIEVLKVTDLSEDKVIARELALIKVSCTGQTRAEVMQIADIYRAKIVDVALDSVVVECTGEEEKIDSLTTLLRKFGIKEISRTGRVAMLRGVSGTTRVVDDE
ncbi:MAG TPA: acetolactate synthase small subunit [Chloroflexota bacterium]|nr:acetolactate synthase small subunit [Chloroflexota bacterium]